MLELHDWFLKEKREFPWRKDLTPYKVWVSEVMLQQTRATVVIPYFEKWMKLFPTVADLASAPLEKVIKAWEGLGYYSRARNLHKGAIQIVDRFGGEIPSRRQDLESICGIGPYTLGAILSFGFRQKAVAVDGNVTRVIARLFCVEENVCKTSVKKVIHAHAESLLDEAKPWITAEALIELGATICTPKPQCGICPIKDRCLGQKKALDLPIKNAEKQTIHLNRTVLLIESQDHVLVKKGEAGKIMADLYEFPYFEMGDDPWTQKEIVERIRKRLGLNARLVKKFPRASHTFTRFKASLYPMKFQLERIQPVSGYEWVCVNRLLELAFSSGHRKLLRNI